MIDQVDLGMGGVTPVRKGPRVLCIRHGESAYNAAFAVSRVDPLLYDSVLSDRGHEQVAQARLALRHEPVELVIVSPFTRAIQTALGIFADHPNAPRFVVDAGHRERLDNSCDRGRGPAELSPEFPSLDLTHLPDVWWHDEGEPDHRGLCVEPQPVFEARVRAFFEAITARPEAVIAVVGHGAFFGHAFGCRVANCQVIEWRPGIAVPVEAASAA